MKRLLLALTPLMIFAVAACSPNPRPSAEGAGAVSSPASTRPGTSPSSSAGSVNESATGRCHTADLALRLGGGDAAAGTQHESLVFTNRSATTCTLYGYPGVSWVTGDQGTQVNDPFERIDANRRTHLTLRPGQHANAVLVTHTAENFPAATCKPIPVRGFRVYPPDETAAIFVPQSQTACSVRGVGLAQVAPLQ